MRRVLWAWFLRCLIWHTKKWANSSSWPQSWDSRICHTNCPKKNRSGWSVFCGRWFNPAWCVCFVWIFCCEQLRESWICENGWSTFSFTKRIWKCVTQFLWKNGLISCLWLIPLCWMCMVLLKYDIYKNLESVKTVGKYSRHNSCMKEIENNKQINESSSSGSFLLVFQNFHEMLIGGKFCSGPPEVKKPFPSRTLLKEHLPIGSSDNRQTHIF